MTNFTLTVHVLLKIVLGAVEIHHLLSILENLLFQEYEAKLKVFPKEKHMKNIEDLPLTPQKTTFYGILQYSSALAITIKRCIT